MLDVGAYMKALEVPALVLSHALSCLRVGLLCGVSSHTLPLLWGWLSHRLGHQSVTCASFSDPSPGQPPVALSQHALYRSSLTHGCLLPGPVTPQA